MLGSEGTIIRPGSSFGLALEVGLFGHNFAKYHDWFMEELGYTAGKPFGLFGWAVNVVTMPVAYASIAVATTLQGIFDFVNDPLGTIGKIGSQVEEAINTIGGFIEDALDAIGGLFGSDNSGTNSGGVDPDSGLSNGFW